MVINKEELCFTFFADADDDYDEDGDRRPRDASRSLSLTIIRPRGSVERDDLVCVVIESSWEGGGIGLRNSF